MKESEKQKKEKKRKEKKHSLSAEKFPLFPVSFTHVRLCEMAPQLNYSSEIRNEKRGRTSKRIEPLLLGPLVRNPLQVALARRRRVVELLVAVIAVILVCRHQI